MSQTLAEKLQQFDLPFYLLHAARHQEEAQIIAHAGHRGRITIATNMAGRGTDIRLEEGVAKLGGVHVPATERHESHRIDTGSCMAALRVRAIRAVRRRL